MIDPLLDECLELMGCETDCSTRLSEAALMEKVITLVRADERQKSLSEWLSGSVTYVDAVEKAIGVVKSMDGWTDSFMEHIWIDLDSTVDRLRSEIPT